MFLSFFIYKSLALHLGMHQICWHHDKHKWAGILCQPIMQTYTYIYIPYYRFLKAFLDKSLSIINSGFNNGELLVYWDSHQKDRLSFSYGRCLLPIWISFIVVHVYNSCRSSVRKDLLLLLLQYNLVSFSCSSTVLCCEYQAAC